MDGDGSISRNKSGKCSYAIRFVSTDSVLTWIMNHLIENGIINREYKFSKRKEGQIASSFEFGGNRQVKKYLDYIYDGATVWLQRKYERYLDLCDYLGGLDNEKEPNRCVVCGAETKKKNVLVEGDGAYNGCILCYKHYYQYKKYGKIIPEKKDHCDMCGDTYGKLIHVGSNYPKYQGFTMCRRHYEQICNGIEPDQVKGFHYNE